MDCTRRLLEEQLFHDRQAKERALQRDLTLENSTKNAYLDHAPWIRRGLDLLEPLNGKITLDLGAGHGWAAMELTSRGAIVFGTDLSLGYCTEAKNRHDRFGCSTPFFQADAERLPLANASVERLWGNAILHHLDTKAAINEVRRILAPRGMAVFCEPWGGNPLITLARKWLPYPGKERTRDETPWSNANLKLWLLAFPNHKVESFEFISALRRFGGTGSNWPLLSRFDRHLFRWFPFLGGLARYRMIWIRN